MSKLFVRYEYKYWLDV